MRLVLGALLAAGMVASPALADTDLGKLYSAPAGSQVSWTGTSPVTDVYTFQMTGKGSVEGVLTPGKKISNFTAVLLSPTNTVLNTFTINYGDNDLAFGTLSAGTYTLKLSGTPASGRGGGSYSLALHSNLSPAPVPGPAGWLVAIAGVGAVAYSIRRRSKAKLHHAAA